MPRSLLDINVMIALLDASHLFHGRAHEWWASKQIRRLGHRQITDVYLLALAFKNGGRVVTFDQGIPMAAAGAQPSHLFCL